MAEQLQEHLERGTPRLWLRRIDRRKQAGEFEEHLKSDCTRVLVAEEDAHVVGFAIGTVEDRGDDKPGVVGSVGWVFVRKERRGKGIGRGLVAALLDFFDSRDVEDVTLRYVVGNQEAEGFWEKLGFEPVIHTVVAYPDEIRRRLRT